ncbi:MAG: NACHT domain-containing protein, partial [Syntrophobacteraceae bacterium]
MSKKIYNWKRFWINREGQLNLSDGGYLSDPDSKYGIFANPDGLPFSSVAGTPCLILLGEPGIGKTHAIETEYRSLVTSGQDRKLILNLRSYSSEDRLHRELSQILASIQETDHSLFLFLDSLDECLLRINTVANLLIDIFRGCPKDRLFLRIACRTAEWPIILEEGLIEIWGQDSVAAYELTPLRRIDAIAAAEANGIDPENFQQEIDRVDAVPLAIKPITLEFLLNTYARSGELPKTQIELYNRGCQILCEEQSLSRLGAKLLGNLSAEQRMAAASRIAAVIIFANKYAVWTGPDLGNVPEEDITIQELAGGTEYAGGVFFEVTDHAVRETLATGLFSSRGAERLGWAHQTYAEFLAAKHLSDHKMALQQILSLIIHPSDPGKRLVPQLHQTVAWIANNDQEVFNEVMRTNPEVLLRSDFATGDDQTRRNLVASLLNLIDREELLNFPRQNREKLSKLKHPNLSEQLKPFINDKSKNLFVRWTAIDIAEACELKELQLDFANMALDPEEDMKIRVEAAHAVYRMGEAEAKTVLIPLAKGEIGEDPDDRLKGISLYAVWPDNLAANELFKILTPPKREMYIGHYQVFLSEEVAKYLQPDDLAAALEWVRGTERRRFSSDPLEEAKDSIILKAWDHLDHPGVLESFAEAVLARIKTHDLVVRGDQTHSFKTSLAHEDEKRRSVLKTLISLLSASDERMSYIAHFNTSFALGKDIPWMIDQLLIEGSYEGQIKWAQMIKTVFNFSDPEQVDAILSSVKGVPALAEVFHDFLMPVELDSPEAEKLRKQYRMIQESQRRERPLVDPPPAQRVASLLDEVESGNLDAWWRLNLEMTLEPDSTYYNHEHESDLTALPGWEAANEDTKARTTRAASRYILEADPAPEKWLGENVLDRPSYSGVRAFRLLMVRDPAFIENLSPEIWKKWAPAILGSPWSGDAHGEELLLNLVKKAYHQAPDEIINTLMALIEKEDREHGHIFSLRKVHVCWDDHLANALFEKAKDAKLKTESIGGILEELVSHHFEVSYDYIRSLLNHYTPEGRRSQLAFFAAEALLEDARVNWQTVWPVLRGDEEFGRKVFESISYGGRRDGGLINSLTEKELAELFVCLSR